MGLKASNMAAVGNHQTGKAAKVSDSVAFDSFTVNPRVAHDALELFAQPMFSTRGLCS